MALASFRTAAGRSSEIDGAPVHPRLNRRSETAWRGQAASAETVATIPTASRCRVSHDHHPASNQTATRPNHPARVDRCGTGAERVERGWNMFERRVPIRGLAAIQGLPRWAFPLRLTALDPYFHIRVF